MGFERLQPADFCCELVRDSGDGHYSGVESISFDFVSRARRSGAKLAVVANGFGLKSCRVGRVKALGDREAQPYVVDPVGFVPAAAEDRIRSCIVRTYSRNGENTETRTASVVLLMLRNFFPSLVP